MNDTDKTNVILSYSPGDFFYTKADEKGLMPDIKQCNKMNVDGSTWDISCNSKNYSDNAEECFRKELCKNKEKVNWIKETENKNNGANRKHLDIKQMYRTEYLNTVNLGIGIVIVTAFIIKNTYNSI